MAPAVADKVTLKSGEVLEGKITEQKDEYLEIRMSSETKRIDPGDIVAVEREDLPQDFFKTDYSPPGDKENKGSIEYISVEAKYGKDKTGDIIDVSGKTGLPDGTIINVTFMKLEFIISFTAAPVKDGVFTARLGPLKRLSEGTYLVEADFYPYMQTEETAEEIKKRWYRKDLQSIGATCSLEIVPVEPLLQVTQIRAELASEVKELKNLNDELENKYAENKGNFKAQAWQKWSKEWLSRLAALKAKMENRIENQVSLFPELQQRLVQNCSTLQLFYVKYETELESPEKYAKSYGGPMSAVYYDGLRRKFKAYLLAASNEVNKGEDRKDEKR